MTIYAICHICKEINEPKEMKKVKGEYVCEKCLNRNQKQEKKSGRR